MIKSENKKELSRSVNEISYQNFSTAKARSKSENKLLLHSAVNNFSAVGIRGLQILSFMMCEFLLELGNCAFILGNFGLRRVFDVLDVSGIDVDVMEQIGSLVLCSGFDHLVVRDLSFELLDL
jgi:hypothetical protein